MQTQENKVSRNSDMKFKTDPDNRNLRSKILSFVSSKLLGKKFTTKSYWENRYKTAGNSGIGSYGQMALLKGEFINQVIQQFHLENAIEFGCGDGNNLAIYQFKDYLGIDISEKAISICREKYLADLSKSFINFESEKSRILGSFLKADCALSIEVLFHILEEDEFKSYLANLFRVATKVVIIIASNRDGGVSKVSPHIHLRKFTGYIEEIAPEWKKITDLKFETKELQMLYNKYFYLYIK